MKKGFLIVSIVSVFLIIALSGVTYAEDLTLDLCKSKARAAAELIRREGLAAMPKIEDANGEFRFADGEGYIWVHNLDGIMIMHPHKTALNGKGLLDMRDVNGVYLFVAMNELVEESGEGWVPYAWPKPGEEVSSPKVSYVVLAEHADDEFVCGAGMYDVTAAEIKARFPDDQMYEE